MGDPILLVYAAIFIGVLFLVEGIYYLVVDARGGEGRRNINRRLRMLSQGLDSSVVLSRLRRKQVGRSEGLRERFLQIRIFKYIERLLTEAGLLVPLWKFLMWVAIVYVSVVGVLAILNTTIDIPFLIPAVVTTVIVGVGPIFFLKRMAASRMRKLEEQLPDSLDMLVRSLRAGHPISSSIQLVAREMADPIGTEFGLAFDEMTYGLDLQQALEHMAHRIPLPDMGYVVVATKLSALSGGNLAEVLGNLARLVRERARIRLKILALSAEGRFSTKILSVLPFAIFGFVSIFNPRYYSTIRQDPTLMYIMGAALVALFIAIMMMRKIVNFRV